MEKQSSTELKLVTHKNVDSFCWKKASIASLSIFWVI
jgi:hypothetical protein